MILKPLLAAALLTTGGVAIGASARADGPNCVPMIGHPMVNYCRMPDNTLAGCPQIGGLLGTNCAPETPDNKKLLAPDQVVPPPFPPGQP
jgi:hypothetical protein